MMVVGPSGSGKTRLVAELIIKQEKLFYPCFDKIIYVYQHWQKIYEKLHKILGAGINFIQGLDWSKINSTPDKARLLIVFDDVYTDASQQEEFLHFVISGRHKNQHAIILNHNLYQESRNSKPLTLMLLTCLCRRILEISYNLMYLAVSWTNASSSYRPINWQPRNLLVIC